MWVFAKNYLEASAGGEWSSIHTRAHRRDRFGSQLHLGVKDHSKMVNLDDLWNEKAIGCFERWRWEPYRNNYLGLICSLGHILMCITFTWEIRQERGFHGSTPRELMLLGLISVMGICILDRQPKTFNASGPQAHSE